MDASAARDAVVQCRDLTVRYGSVIAADGVCLDAARGEIVGLLGPNGAGKTSVIRTLTTIVAPTSGTARVGGHDISDAARVRSVIGVLPESNGYPSSRSAFAYLRFYGELFGLTRAEAGRRAARQLQRLGLANNRDPIGTYSRGMRQRLGLARAMINEPAVLFLDEPTLGLDPAGQEELLGHLTAAAVEEDTCVVLCSHLLDEVERVCDRVEIMHDARVVASGTVAQVVAASGVAGRGRLRINPDDVVAADAALSTAGVARSVRFDNTRPGDLDIELDATDDPGVPARLLGALLAAGVVPRSFDLLGARLGDAFRALTASGGRSG